VIGPVEPRGLLAEHVENPRCVGELVGDNVVSAVAGRRETGTRIQLFLLIQRDTIEAARFHAYGCPVAIGACSRLCEWLQGRTLAEAGEFDPHALASELDVPVDRLGVILVAEDALRGCLAQCRGDVSN
jgi:nitrogen fixation NifU-like protein